MNERVIPTLRGDRQIHGKSHYFAGITGFSSTPNFENDHDWWLDYEQNMDKRFFTNGIFDIKVVQAILNFTGNYIKSKED